MLSLLLTLRHVSLMLRRHAGVRLPRCLSLRLLRNMPPFHCRYAVDDVTNARFSLFAYAQMPLARLMVEISHVV